MEHPTNPPFRVLDDSSVEIDEGLGNSFHLGPILRKYTSAKLQFRTGRRGVTVIEPSLLYDALGLLRSLQYDVAQFNAAAVVPPLSSSSLRYACYRLTRQAASFGVRVPRAGTGTVEVPGLEALIAHVEKLNSNSLAAARALIEGGIVEFAGLAELFRPGAELLDRGMCTGFFGIPMALRVRACFFSRGKSLFGTVSTFFAALEFVVCLGTRFAVVECQLPVAEFQGTRSTHDGLDSMIMLTTSVRTELLRRGERYESLACEATYAEYEGNSFVPSPRGNDARMGIPRRSRGGGRIMIDSQAALARGVHCARSEGVACEAVKGVFKLMARRSRGLVPPFSSSDDDINSGGQAAAAAEEESLELLLLSAPLPQELRLLTWPVVAGFSLQAKAWGLVAVSGLRDVTFNEEAFARLVLPDSRKQLIKALVLSHAQSSSTASSSPVLVSPAGAGGRATTDVIEGKGEGTIFLLHGPPGVGKTLTAEAVAELLHRPLYTVSIGELGTTPEILEERLMDVFDLCVPWGALVLIDEAEMLLECRTKSDNIVRNAMVCVMLRLVEYYRGILFLTTNRVECLDPAFQSRVQCALRYQPLNAAGRRAIWEDLLARRGAGEVDTEVDLDSLAAHELNGRQIKNVLQLALALARHENVPLGKRHLAATLEVTVNFIGSVS